MFEEYLKECFIFNMFGLNIWRRYRASPMQVYPKGDGADWAGDGYADQETDVTVSIQCFIQVVCNYSFHSMFHSGGLQLVLRSSFANMQEQVSYDAGAVWDEVLDIASYGQRKLSSLSCCFRSCFLMSFVRISRLLAGAGVV